MGVACRHVGYICVGWSMEGGGGRLVGRVTISFVLPSTPSWVIPDSFAWLWVRSVHAGFATLSQGTLQCQARKKCHRHVPWDEPVFFSSLGRKKIFLSKCLWGGGGRARM